MRPVLHITATGKGFLTLLLGTLAALGLIGVIFGIAPALGIGLGLIAATRLLMALLRPSEPGE